DHILPSIQIDIHCHKISGSSHRQGELMTHPINLGKHRHLILNDGHHTGSTRRTLGSCCTVQAVLSWLSGVTLRSLLTLRSLRPRRAGLARLTLRSPETARAFIAARSHRPDILGVDNLTGNEFVTVLASHY